jgi:hypothetical protein
MSDVPTAPAPPTPSAAPRRGITLDDLSRLLEAYEKLDLACRCIDHCHPPHSIRPALNEIQRLREELGLPL